MTSRLSAYRCRRAFTLVEVCIALGIMSFTLVVMLGILPSGLSQLNSTIDKNRAATIFQNVLTEAKQTDFQELAQKNSYQRFFSAEGIAVAAGARNIAYTVNVSVNKNGGTYLPGDSSVQDTLLTVTVELRRTPGGTDTLANPPVGKTVSLLACNDLSALTAKAN